MRLHDCQSGTGFKISEADAIESDFHMMVTTREVLLVLRLLDQPKPT